MFSSSPCRIDKSIFLVFRPISEIEELLNNSFSFSVWETRGTLKHEFITERAGDRRRTETWTESDENSKYVAEGQRPEQ
jgi:hypothetical protein